MPRYALDDPRLQVELDRLAAETAADWPELDEGQMEQLGRLLPLPSPAVPPRKPRHAARSGQAAA